VMGGGERGKGEMGRGDSDKDGFEEKMRFR